MSNIATQPYTKAVAISKSDTINYDGTTASVLAGTQNKAIPADAIFVGGTGLVVLILEDGTAVNFTCATGQVLPVKSIRVNSTTTAATLMVALYYV